MIRRGVVAVALALLCVVFSDAASWAWFTTAVGDPNTSEDSFFGGGYITGQVVTGGCARSVELHAPRRADTSPDADYAVYVWAADSVPDTASSTGAEIPPLGQAVGASGGTLAVEAGQDYAVVWLVRNVAAHESDGMSVDETLAGSIAAACATGGGGGGAGLTTDQEAAVGLGFGLLVMCVAAVAVKELSRA